MAMVTINGVELPGMREYKIDIEPLGSFERNANGKLVGDLIDIKTKISCSWEILEGKYVDMLMKAVKPFFIKVKYLDIDGSYKTKDMYTSPQSASLALMRNNKMWWKSVSINLIEV